MICIMDKELISLKMVINMLENGKKMKSMMIKAFILMLTEGNL